ncbi:secreted protein [Beggiatoa sp. PS]|nr:secreted protein [Beggiatoa sp. PS]
MQEMKVEHHQYWKSLISLPFLLIGLLLTLLPPPVFAFVGYVDYVNGPSIAFSLNGQRAIVSIGKKLNEGDRIRVLKSGASVTVLLGSQRVQITDTHNNPYTVPKPPPPKNGFFTVVSNLVTDLFNWNHRTTMAMTRGIDCQQQHGTTNLRLSIPLLKAEKNAKLLAGERPLSFGWAGGSSPYEVQVYRQVNRSSKEINQLRTRFTEKCAFLKEIRLQNWNFKEGERYKVKVIDNNQQIAVGNFIVVSRRYDPRLQSTAKEIKELQASSLLRTIWFAQQRNGEWQFEAYQQFLGIDDQTHSAKILKRGLAEGVSLPTH